MSVHAIANRNACAGKDLIPIELEGAEPNPRAANLIFNGTMECALMTGVDRG